MYQFIPLRQRRDKVKQTENLSQKQIDDALDDFHMITCGDKPCTVPSVFYDDLAYRGEVILFSAKSQKIGTADFNIPCDITLDSSSEEIKKAIEAYFESLSIYQERRARTT